MATTGLVVEYVTGGAVVVYVTGGAVVGASVEEVGCPVVGGVRLSSGNGVTSA